MRTISLNELSVGYNSKNKTPRAVLSGINATLRAGELTCLVGPNGIGKSTLLRTIAAFQPSLGGRILYNDDETGEKTNLTSITPAQRARMVSVVLTTKPDVNNLSVEEVVGLGRSPYTNFWGTLTPSDRAAVEQSLCLVGISDLKKRMIQTLSDGERQKTMIAKALAQQTPVMVLDEPTAFLDFKSKVDMLLLLRTLAHETGKMVLLSTHDLEQAMQQADCLWVLKNDSMLTVTTPAALERDMNMPAEGVARTQALLDIFTSRTASFR